MKTNIRFMSFSSGSCGNCYFIGLEEEGRISAGVLVDAGVSLRRLKKELDSHGLTSDSFSAILVTHDHLDHIKHLGSLCKYLEKPVYSEPSILNALARHSFTRDHISKCRKDMSAGEWSVISPGKLMVKYFIVPHDATQTVGYGIVIGGFRFVIMTDIGAMTDEALAFARNADTVVLESNYDREMLLSGPYPYDLKMRICRGCGHLSNDKCAQAIRSFYHSGLKHIYLCHLSENNNTPELAFAASAAALGELGFSQSYPSSTLFEKEGETITLAPLPRQTSSQLYTL